MKPSKIFICRSSGIWILVLSFFFISIQESKAQAPDWEWVQPVHSIKHEYAYDVAVDPTSGDVVVVGSWEDEDLSAFWGTSAWAPTDFTSTYGNTDGFVAKYTSEGNLVWAFKIGGSNDDYVNAVDIDDAGYIYITGSVGVDNNIAFSGVADTISNNTISLNAGGNDSYIAKYSSDGYLQWLSYSFSETGDFAAYDVAVDDSSVYISGAGEGEASFGSASFNCDNGGMDSYVARFDLDGNSDWVAVAGSVIDDFSYSLVADNNNVYVTGDFLGDDLYVFNRYNELRDTLTISTKNKEDIFILSYSSNGTVNWAEQIASSYRDYSGSIAEYGDHLYLTGGFASPADFPGYSGNPVSGGTGTSVFICSVNKSNGNTPWVNTIEASHSEMGKDIAVSSTGNVFVTGHFGGDLTFPESVILSTTGVEALFIACYNTDGDFIWAKKSESNETVHGNGIAVGPLNSLYVAGFYSGLATFDLLTAPNNNSTDNIFLSKIGTACTDVIADAGPDQTDASMCGISSAAMEANTPTEGNGFWSILSGSGGTIAAPAHPLSNFEGSPGETYELEWTIINGTCSSSDTVIISFFEEATIADAGLDQTDVSMCGLTFTELAANDPINGTGLWSILSGSGGVIEETGNPTSNFSGTGGETYELQWTITNIPCSPSTDKVTITFNLELAADAGIDQDDGSMCGITTTALAAKTPSSGSGLWSIVSGNGGAIQTPDDPQSNFEGTAGETYEMEWAIINGTCSSSDTVIISFHQEVSTADAGPDQIELSMCGLTSTVLEANTPSSGTGFWSVVSGVGGVIQTPDNPTSNFSGNEGETYILSWTITNDPCTASTDEVTITFYRKPVADAGNGASKCGLEFQLGAAPVEGTGTWTMTSGTGTVSFAPDANYNMAVAAVSTYGNKEFTWTVDNGTCSAESTIWVDFLEELTTDAGSGGEECDLDFVFQAQLSYGTGVWSKRSGPGASLFLPSENDPGASVDVDEYGEYEFVWTESLESCSGSASVKVIFNEPPSAYAGPDQKLDNQFETNLEAEEPHQGQKGTWSVKDGSATFTDLNDPITVVEGLFLGRNVFIWEVENRVCPKASDEVVIDVEGMLPPTVFTPNMDGLNDRLIFPGLEGFEDLSIIIFNRWGSEVYRSDDYDNDWDGKDQKGRELKKDTYYYILKISNDRTVKGFIEIKR